jgi:hypothetical protein
MLGRRVTVESFLLFNCQALIVHALDQAPGKANILPAIWVYVSACRVHFLQGTKYTDQHQYHSQRNNTHHPLTTVFTPAYHDDF